MMSPVELAEWARSEAMPNCKCENCGSYNRIADLIEQGERLRAAITLTIEENLHLADGDDCTLRHLTALNIHERQRP